MYEKALQKIKECERCKPNFYCPIVGPTGPTGPAGGTQPVSEHLVITQIQ